MAKLGMTRAVRKQRDALVLRLYVSGYTPAMIAAHPKVALSLSQVGRIVRAELDRAAKDHMLRNENAMTIYLARMEVLVREAMAQAEGGDLKAIEAARRLLADQAKVSGLADEDLNVRNPVPPLSDAELANEAEVDDLARYRAQKKAVASTVG